MSPRHVVLAMAPYSFWRQVLLVLCIGLWLLTDNPLTKEVVASGMLLSVIAVLILQVSLNHRAMQRVIADKSHVADYSDYREWTKVGLQLGMTLLFVQFSRDLTLVFSSLSLSPEDIGVLGIATAIGAHLGGVEGAAYGSSVAWLFWTLSLALFARKYVRHDVSMFSVTSLFFKK